jgi:hypothetical protein
MIDIQNNVLKATLHSRRYLDRESKHSERVLILTLLPNL